MSEDYFPSAAGVNRLFFFFVGFNLALSADLSGIDCSIYKFHSVVLPWSQAKVRSSWASSGKDELTGGNRGVPRSKGSQSNP